MISNISDKYPLRRMTTTSRIFIKYTINQSNGNTQGVVHVQNQNYLATESLNVQFKMTKMAIKIPIIVTTTMMNSIKEIVKGAHINTQHQNSAHPRNSLIDCDGVQPTNAQCHIVPISILWYWESWHLQFKKYILSLKHFIFVPGGPYFVPTITFCYWYQVALCQFPRN